MLTAQTSIRDAARGVATVGGLAIIATALLLVGGELTTTTAGAATAPHLIAQFGVSTAAAGAIITALENPLAIALSIALVPLGLGFAAITIRATWATLTATLGVAGARTAIRRF